LADFFLHGVFEDVFLRLDEGALFLVVFDALAVFAPVAAPPVAPGVFAGCAAVSCGGNTFFASGGSFSASTETATLVADDGNETAAAQEAEGYLQGDNVRRSLIWARWQLSC
jgi:hypothetical protein